MDIEFLNDILSSIGLPSFNPGFNAKNSCCDNAESDLSSSEDDTTSDSEDDSELYSDSTKAAQAVSAAETAVSEAASNVETLEAERAAIRLEESEAKKKHRELRTQRRNKDGEIRKAQKKQKEVEKKLGRAKKAVKSFAKTPSADGVKKSKSFAAQPFNSEGLTFDNVLNALIPVVDTVIKNINETGEPGTVVTPSVSKSDSRSVREEEKEEEETIDFTGTELDDDSEKEKSNVFESNVKSESEPKPKLEESEQAEPAQSHTPTVEEPVAEEATDFTFTREVESSSTDTLEEMREESGEHDTASKLDELKRVLDRNIESYNNVYHAVTDDNNDAFTPGSSDDEDAGSSYKLPLKIYVSVLDRVQRKFEEVYSSLDELDVPKSKSLRRMKHGLTGLAVSYSDKTDDLLKQVKKDVEEFEKNSEKSNDVSDVSSVSSWTNVKSKGRKIEIEDVDTK